MSKASQPQLELVAALGQFEGRDMTKEQASGLINSAKAQGVEPDWKLKDAAFLKIAQIMKRRTVAALKKAKAKGEDSVIIGALEEQLEWLNEDIDEHKEELRLEKEEAKERIQEEREDLKEEKEIFKERVNEVHSWIDVYDNYETLTKKPTKKEVGFVLKGLDEAKPDWELDSNSDCIFINNLASNFEHLRTSMPRPGAQEKTPQIQRPVTSQIPNKPLPQLIAQALPSFKKKPSRRRKFKKENVKILYTLLFSCLALALIFIVMVVTTGKSDEETKRDRRIEHRERAKAHIEQKKLEQLKE